MGIVDMPIWPVWEILQEIGHILPQTGFRYREVRELVESIPGLVKSLSTSALDSRVKKTIKQHKEVSSRQRRSSKRHRQQSPEPYSRKNYSRHQRSPSPQKYRDHRRYDISSSSLQHQKNHGRHQRSPSPLCVGQPSHVTSTPSLPATLSMASYTSHTWVLHCHVVRPIYHDISSY